VKLKPEKNSVLNGIGTHGLCDTGAMLGIAEVMGSNPVQNEFFSGFISQLLNLCV